MMILSATRNIVLYPGAFRPPHQAHFDNVKRLASRPEVDEVVVIISNRVRTIPGTAQVLGPEVAVQIWSIYLQGMSKVRVELATTSAVHHALQYVESGEQTDVLLLCVGAKDLEQGSGRFDKLPEIAARAGREARVIAGPAAELEGRATELRRLLADGPSGFPEFRNALPRHLSAEEQHLVWDICRSGMRDLQQTIQTKIREVVKWETRSTPTSVAPTVGGKTDEVFRVTLENGTTLYVKHAAHRVRDDGRADRDVAKPRARLAAEYRALKWLASLRLCDVCIPTTDFFCKKTRTLGLGEVKGRSLLSFWDQGRVHIEATRAASRFLAQCRQLPPPPEPFWDSEGADLQQWRKRLTLRTTAMIQSPVGAAWQSELKSLWARCDNAKRAGFSHLDFVPQSIIVRDTGIGVIDFESCSSISDPAFDLGVFVGHIMASGLASSSCGEFFQAVDESVTVAGVTSWKQKDESRMIAVSGATLIGLGLKTDNSNAMRSLLVLLGCQWLRVGIRETYGIKGILRQAIQEVAR